MCSVCGAVMSVCCVYVSVSHRRRAGLSRLCSVPSWRVLLALCVVVGGGPPPTSVNGHRRRRPPAPRKPPPSPALSSRRFSPSHRFMEKMTQTRATGARRDTNRTPINTQVPEKHNNIDPMTLKKREKKEKPLARELSFSPAFSDFQILQRGGFRKIR